MSVPAVAAAAAMGATLAVIGALAWRRNFRRDQPLYAWGGDWPSGEAAVRAAAAQTGLSVVPVPDGWQWFADLAFSPVWLFWGDLRTRRPERHLQRWRLEGVVGDTPASITFTREALTASVTVSGALSPLWAAPPARVDCPLAEQEGVRPLMPLGSPRWRTGSNALERCFALGATAVRAEHGRLSATVPLVRDTPPPARWPELFDALGELARGVQRE